MSSRGRHLQVRHFSLILLWACIACTSEVRSEPPGAIVNVWTTLPPASEQTLPGFDELALFERVAHRLEERFVLPYNLYVSHRPCNAANAYYDPIDARIRMCDELLARVVQIVGDDPEKTHEEVLTQVTGTWVWMFLHEVGHAFITMFQLPVLGNEEYAVDDFAAILLVEAGEAGMAQLAVNYWVASASSEDTDFADDHGLDLQRYYRGLCLVYGSDPVAHADIVQDSLLPTEHATRCADQYEEALRNWEAALGDRLKAAP